MASALTPPPYKPFSLGEKVTCPTNVAILMATFNGERYIEEQLQSLANQTYKNITVYIHDDQSTDGTLEVIRKFAAQSDLKIHIFEDQQRRGCRDSFIAMLEHVEANYYMFSDQDDVWLPEKISKSLALLAKLENSEGEAGHMPCLVHTDQVVVDANLNIISRSIWEAKGIDVLAHRKLGILGSSNIYAGCTEIFNRALRDKSLEYNLQVRYHDYWVAIVAVAFGKVASLAEGTILYRQHGFNSVSACLETSCLNWKQRIFAIIQLSRDYDEVFEMFGMPRWKVRCYKIIHELQKLKLLPGYHPYQVGNKLC